MKGSARRNARRAPQVFSFVLRTLSIMYVKSSLEIIPGGGTVSPADEYLPYPGLAPKRRSPRERSCRSERPAQPKTVWAFPGDYILKPLFRFLSQRTGLEREISFRLRNPLPPGGVIPSAPKASTKNAWGFWNSIPATVSRVRLASAGPAVLEVL